MRQQSPLRVALIAFHPGFGTVLKRDLVAF
jgi:hypothetical protein